MADNFWQKKAFFGSAFWTVFDSWDIFDFVFRRKANQLVFKFHNNLTLKTVKSEKGATLLEMLVVMGIIAILTLIVVPNYRPGGSQLALQRSANKLSQDIRRAEEMAVSAKECGACGGVPQGYGIYLAAGDATYLLYADNGNEKYGGGDVQIEIISLENGVRIKSISTGSPLSINFKPPDPAVKISNGGGDPDNTTIILELQADTSKIKNVKVNKAGLIYAE